MRPLTLLGRSLILAVSELAANAICWTVAGILFGRNQESRSILSLALLAWTLGLRHALDADHIRFEVSPQFDFLFLLNIYTSAIDNATRGLISMGQLPVTCGLFFSLGHSTIVIIVTVAIAISSNLFEKMENTVGKVGGIVGAAVSGSFLFIVGVANTVILWRILLRRRRDALRRKQGTEGDVANSEEQMPHHNSMLMMRILGPMINFVDRPWKMYPVGVLFGFGFDTASSVALLAISAIAKRSTNGQTISSSNTIILPFLFTAGMTLIDSTDSILMLYSYAGFPEHSWALFEKASPTPEPRDRTIPQEDVTAEKAPNDINQSTEADENEVQIVDAMGPPPEDMARPLPNALQGVNEIHSNISRDTAVKMNVMSGLSIILTLMSILVAFSISLITIMGLIGEQCARCNRAADAADGGGLEGSWWRAWARANDNSGYIGAAIVGSFLAIVVMWYGIPWAMGKARVNEEQISKPVRT